jgi:hypothetical protein
MNRLIIDGPQEDRQRFLQEIWTGERIFQTVLPEPKEYTDDIIDDLLDSYSHSDIDITRDEIVKSPSCYWCSKRWGTKWDLYSEDDYGISDDGTEIDFETAWGPPVPIIRAMSMQYPTLNIRLKYIELDNVFAGEGTFVAGEGDDHYYEDSDNFNRILGELGYDEELVASDE